LTNVIHTFFFSSSKYEKKTIEIVDESLLLFIESKRRNQANRNVVCCHTNCVRQKSESARERKKYVVNIYMSEKKTKS